MNLVSLKHILQQIPPLQHPHEKRILSLDKITLSNLRSSEYEREACYQLSIVRIRSVSGTEKVSTSSGSLLGVLGRSLV